MRYFRSSNNPNTLVAVFMLVLLAIFAGPTMLPNLLPSILPGADESIPCEWLRTGDDRAEHQSLLGRTIENPLSLRVRSSALPSQPSGSLNVAIIITNHSIGTVAIYFNHDVGSRTLLGDDNQTSGLGLVFNPQRNVAAGGSTNGAIPEEDIRLLGPRQSCVHHEIIPFAQIPQLGLGPGENTVKAYYRNTSRGTVQAQNGTAQIIYPDQGLWVGVVESDTVTIPLAGS
jgi:hypothetical protein